MALIKCPDCASDVSTAAPACPKCGRPTAAAKKGSKTIPTGWGLVIIVVATVWIVAANINGNSDSSGNVSGTSSGSASTAQTTPDESRPIKTYTLELPSRPIQTAPYVTTLAKLNMDFGRNVVAMHDKIGTRPVQLSGYLGETAVNGMNQVELHMFDGDGNLVGLFTLKDDPGQRIIASKLRAFDKLTLLCPQINFYGISGADDCAIIKVQPVKPGLEGAFHALTNSVNDESKALGP
ncbi:MAG: hypothetical protein ACREV7_16650 [Steroidobacteraceae bacterium]